MQKATTPKTMRDSSGQDIPLKYVSKYDRERDARTRRILARYLKARAVLESCLADSLADIEAIQAARDTETAAKGNFQCQSFDGTIQIQIDQAWNISLDDRVREAREILLNYARSLCAKAGDDAQALLQIVEQAFAVSKSGRLSIGRVLSLCRLKLTEPECIRAQKLLMDSIQTDKGRAYLRVYHRPDTQQDWAMVKLDIADCWPAAATE